MKVTLVDPDDGSEFDIQITAGAPTTGSLLAVSARDGADQRIYEVVSVSGSSIMVRRKPLCVGVIL